MAKCLHCAKQMNTDWHVIDLCNACRSKPITWETLAFAITEILTPEQRLMAPMTLGLEEPTILRVCNFDVVKRHWNDNLPVGTPYILIDNS